MVQIVILILQIEKLRTAYLCTQIYIARLCKSRFFFFLIQIRTFLLKTRTSFPCPIFLFAAIPLCSGLRRIHSLPEKVMLVWFPFLWGKWPQVKTYSRSEPHFWVCTPAQALGWLQTFSMDFLCHGVWNRKIGMASKHRKRCLGLLVPKEMPFLGGQSR